MNRAFTTIVVFSSCLTGFAGAQDLTLELVDTIDIAELSSSGASVFVGKYPNSIAWNGQSLFVGGYEGTGLGATTEIAQIVDVLDGPGSWTIQAVGGSSADTPPFRGRPGMDWDDTLGLIATHDLGNNAEPAQIQRFVFDVDTISLIHDQSSVSGSGVAGPSWDYGPATAGGFARSDLTRGAIAGIMDYRESNPVGLLGPLGYDPFDLTSIYSVQQDDSSGTVYGGGGPDISPSGTTDTLWRDVDFNPDGGIAARVTQDLIIAERDGTNLQTSVVKVSDPTDEALMAGNNVAWVYDVPCLTEDALIWNDRGPGCIGILTDAIRVSNRNGTDATYIIVDDLGTEITAWPNANCVYDYAWDPDAQLLFVMEATTKSVYVLQPVCPDSCPPDMNGDGILDNGDIGAFITVFLASDLAADFNGDGILDNGDIGAFVAAFLAGCP